MFIKILGSSAGGGLPQWNCNCSNCKAVRAGCEHIQARTQSSIAVSKDKEKWVIINASPDILQQLKSFKEILGQGPRETKLEAVILTDSQLDHTTGLLMLREGCPLDVYATHAVKEDLTAHFPLFELLKNWQGGLRHQAIALKQPFTIGQLNFLPLKLSSEAPPYSPYRNKPLPEHSIALYIYQDENSAGLLYAPAIGEPLNAELQHYANKSACIMIDGTFWREDEMRLNQVGDKLAKDMGHLPLKNGIINELKPFTKSRKILVHINNTNPILNTQSEEYAELTSQNIEVGFDGMQVEL